MSAPATPAEVRVQLSGEDGNVFSIVGRVTKALRRAGFAQAADEYGRAALACDSYDAVLRLTMATVDVQ